MTITIGQIEYANCTPIFTALHRHFTCSGYHFVRGVPAALNKLLASGEIDVSPSSSIEYAKYPDRYLILPELSISAIGAVKSVLLFSRVPLTELSGATIGMTTESDTSVNLLKIILGKFHGFTNRFERTDLALQQALEAFPALLLIGDNALKESLTATDLLVYDLGELWRHFTGLPFVFALWLIRRATVGERPEAVRQLSAELIRAKRIAYDSYPEIAAESPERSWCQRDVLVDYWQTISYDLTSAHLDGLKSFYRFAAELGLVAAAPEISLYGGSVACDLL